ncbi:hypothetical protein ACFSSA_13845 [Luteolibacter algae]|uniref:TPM domain-containing protein n=1 Tax=Luteolibacter algae TaxID=454151 RepID=A0ABW5DCV4_9BACT
MNEEREYSPKRFAISAVTCPACHAKINRDTKWCESCGFTGAKSLDMFGDSPPPLLPLLDVADFWSKKEEREIDTSIKRFNKRFPQFHWKICAVTLEANVSLPLFGFWLMNVCPLAENETAEDREWSVLLLVDARTGRASVTTGYRSELWLSDEMWNYALRETVTPFRRGDSGQAVCAFLKSAQALMEKAWTRSQKQLSHKSQ